MKGVICMGGFYELLVGYMPDQCLIVVYSHPL